MAFRVTALKVIALGAELAFLWLQNLKTIPPQGSSEDGAEMAISESPGQVFGKRSLPHPINWTTWRTELEEKEKVLECLLVCFYNASWTCPSRNLSWEITHRCTWTMSIDTLTILFKIKKKIRSNLHFHRKRGNGGQINYVIYVCIYISSGIPGSHHKRMSAMNLLKRISETHLTEKSRSGRKRVLQSFFS